MKIILAIDGSPCSDLAVEEVARRPWPPETVVQVVTVDAPAAPPLVKGSSPTVFDEILRQQQAEDTQRLNQAVNTIRTLAPHLQVLPKLLQGSPKDVLVDEAGRWAADLIVVGSHGYGPISRFFLGSVSLYVALNAPCSVLIVRCSPERCPLPGEPTTT